MATFEEIIRLRNNKKIRKLSKILLRENEHQAVLAAKALGELKDKKAVAFLIKALRRSETIVQEEAAKALGEIGDEKAIKPLSDALNNENPSLNKVISCAVEKIENSGTTPHYADKATETINHTLTKESERNLIKQLDSDNREVVTKAIEQLGEGKSLQSKAKIEELSKHDDAIIAISALLALYRLGDNSVFNTLLYYTKYELKPEQGPEFYLDRSTFEIKVHDLAIEALGKTGDEKALPMLEKLLSTYFKRAVVISALSYIPSTTSVSIISTWLDKAFYDSDYQAVEKAVYNLRTMYENGIEQAYDALIKALYGKFEIAGVAAMRIAELGIVDAELFEYIRKLTHFPPIQRKAEYAIRTMLWNDREGILPNTK